MSDCRDEVSRFRIGRFHPGNATVRQSERPRSVRSCLIVSAFEAAAGSPLAGVRLLRPTQPVLIGNFVSEERQKAAKLATAAPSKAAFVW